MNSRNLNLLTICALASLTVSQSAYAETFSEAFAKAKADGLAEFTYKGNLSSTQTADELLSGIGYEFISSCPCK